MIGVYTRLSHFLAMTVHGNNDITGDMKNSYLASFSLLCPAWVPHRWQYKYEIYTWLLQRRNTIQFLFPLLPDGTSTAQETSPEHSFTDVEMQAILIVVEDTPESERYWLTLQLLQPLHDWGHRLSGFLHVCDCHHEQLLQGKFISCCHKGRRGSTFAGVERDRFRRELQNMTPAALTVARATTSALTSLLVAFVSSVSKVCHRFMLVFGFWDKLPWCIFKLYYAEVHQTAEAKALVVEWCRQIVQQYEQRGSTSVGAVARRFLDPQHPSGLRTYIDVLSRCYVMPVELSDELLCYTSGLIVMQLLESRHHLVGICLAHGRAGQLPKVSAEMRRRLNTDSTHQVYRANLDSYMARLQDRTSLLPQAVAEECGSSLSSFYAAVYGSHIQMMHASVMAESQLVEAYKGKIKRVAATGLALADQEEESMTVEYMRAILLEGQFFTFQADGEATTSEASQPYYFQVVSAHPERKANIEKISHLGEDCWRGCIGIAQLFPERVFEDRLVVSRGFELDALNLASCFEDGCHNRLSVFQQVGYGKVFKPEDVSLPAICDGELVQALGDIGSVYILIGDELVQSPGMTENQLVQKLSAKLTCDDIKSAIVELKDQGVIVASNDVMDVAGQLEIVDAHVSRSLVLAQPITIQESRACLQLCQLSRLELRQRLLADQWRIADVDNKADLVSKRLMPHNTLLYYQCLLHKKVGHMLGLSHSANDGYYKCMIAMMDGYDLCDWSHIPVCRNSEFFSDLEDFLRGVSGASDPRLQDDRQVKKMKLRDMNEGADRVVGCPLGFGHRPELDLPHVDPVAPASPAPSKASEGRSNSSGSSRSSSSSSRSSTSSGRRSRSPRRTGSSGRRSRSPAVPEAGVAGAASSSAGPQDGLLKIKIVAADCARGPDLVRGVALERVLPHLQQVANRMPEASWPTVVSACVAHLPPKLQDWGGASGRAGVYYSKTNFEAALVKFYRRQSD